LRILASFSPSNALNAPDAAFLQKLSHDTGVELTYVRSLTPSLHVLVLSADDADDPDCQRALGRLRSDPRVRSADIDQRRQPQRSREGAGLPTRDDAGGRRCPAGGLIRGGFVRPSAAVE